LTSTVGLSLCCESRITRIASAPRVSMPSRCVCVRHIARDSPTRDWRAVLLGTYLCTAIDHCRSRRL